MFSRRSIRIGVVMGVLAVAWTAPVRAAGWGEIWDWAEGLRPHVLAWLGLAPEPAVLKDCAHIDPNGLCVKGSSQDQRAPRSIRGEGAEWVRYFDSGQITLK